MFLKTIYFCLIFWTVACAKSKKQKGCFRQRSKADCQALKIRCPRGSIIYNPTIWATDKTCRARNPSSLGQPVDLIVNIAECYWKPKCLIKFPRNPLFQASKIDDVNTLQVKEWTCISQKEKSTYFSHGICEGTKYITSYTDGVILSHPNIPWNYDFGKNIKNNAAFQCRKLINMDNHRYNRIHISTHMFDIDKNTDQLYINDKLVPRTGLDQVFNISSGNVSIRFETQPGQYVSKGGRGFVICFNKIENNATVFANTSACAKLLKTYRNAQQTMDMTDINCNKKFTKKCPANVIKGRCRDCKLKGVNRCSSNYKSTCSLCCPDKDIRRHCKRVRRKIKQRTQNGKSRRKYHKKRRHRQYKLL
ncbi:uncharacterized protein LOC127726294 [Mytilus californianus]|uniref:uncharacterized protein LOC127726294 n=1 Tax=Mytilus californianus TaxID=6549 RepID=UPI0022451FD0|nr:uncharacterized protein LOC127726294 [Mytilus californianus]